MMARAEQKDTDDFGFGSIGKDADIDLAAFELELIPDDCRRASHAVTEKLHVSGRFFW